MFIRPLASDVQKLYLYMVKEVRKGNECVGCKKMEMETQDQNNPNILCTPITKN